MSANNKEIFFSFKSDFPFFKKNHDLVFFDSAATNLKPQVVIDAVNDYYQNYSTSTHSINFPLAAKTAEIYESCRQEIANFINCQSKEVIFCPSATFALNQIAYSLEPYLKQDDEIILTTYEHSSLLLPFYRLAKEKKVILKFVESSSDGLICEKNLKKVLTKKTKIVAFASMNNSFGTVNDVKKLTKIIKKINVEETSWPFKKPLVLIDGAQSINHSVTDVSDWGIDFFTFSGHKLFGPTGVGVWWSKYEWLKLFKPLVLGGGMSGAINKDGTFYLLNPPECFEAGTPNIAGVFGLRAAIKYVSDIGLENIYKYEKNLKAYAVEQLKKNFSNKIVIYNEKQESGLLLFNVVNVCSEEVASYLGTKKIALRSGNFCSKLLSEVINAPSSLRISFSIFNDKDDVDYLIKVLQQALRDWGDFLNGFF